MKYVLLFLAVVVGFIIASLSKSKNLNQVSLYLAFSGAFLLLITVFELLPEVYHHDVPSTELWIMMGILLQIILEFLSKGAEHGHVHIDVNTNRFPWMLFIGLSIHAFLEGFPTVDNTKVLIGVLVHKIPVAVILAFFFIKAEYSKTKTLSFLFLFACMTPLGAYFSKEITFVESYLIQIHALVIGIFLHVATTILFESSKDHKFNLVKLLTIVVAIGIAYIL